MCCKTTLTDVNDLGDHAYKLEEWHDDTQTFSRYIFNANQDHATDLACRAEGPALLESVADSIFVEVECKYNGIVNVKFFNEKLRYRFANI